MNIVILALARTVILDEIDEVNSIINAAEM